MATNDKDAGTGSAVELTLEECQTLLHSQPVGRVGFQTPDGPRIVPVNFSVDEAGAIEFRTTSYSELASYAPGAAVAFEVDELDPEHHAGWSVVALGACERVMEKDSAVFGAASEPRTTPWAGGRRPMLLRIASPTLSGRRVGPGQAGHEVHHPDARPDARPDGR